MTELIGINLPGILSINGGLSNVDEEGYDVDDFNDGEDDYEFDDNVAENFLMNKYFLK